MQTDFMPDDNDDEEEDSVHTIIEDEDFDYNYNFTNNHHQHDNDNGNNSNNNNSSSATAGVNNHHTRTRSKMGEKKFWTDPEDQQLVELVDAYEKIYGKKNNWAEICKQLPGRSREQCRYVYVFKYICHNAF